MTYFRWTPSKTQKQEFAEKMNAISDFCEKNGIRHSSSFDSYYFIINGIEYRVSNHTVEASNRGAYDEDGNRIREEYHPEGELKDHVYITAGKTRIIEIYKMILCLGIN